MVFVFGCRPVLITSTMIFEQTATWGEFSLSDAIVLSDYLPFVRL